MTLHTDGLRVGLIAPCWFPVPPDLYGGIEEIVALLADGLVATGHDVTLFASGSSRTTATLVSVFDEPPSPQIGETEPELRHLLAALGQASAFDVLHDHTGMLGLALGGLVETPVLHTVHGPLDGKPGRMYDAICALNPRARLVSLSENQRRPRPDLPWVATVPNAIDVSRYPVSDGRDDYVAFLGRMSPSKGCHTAIETARAAGVHLRIAAKCREPGEIAYFEEHVEPHLGEGVEYIGEVGDEEKVELLRRARALLFPIEWEEPFGLVMVEAMACGTPVVATRRGSVPEVVQHGRGGVIVDDAEDLPGAIAVAERLDPDEIRRSVEERFTIDRMVAGYVDAYRTLVAEREPGRARGRRGEGSRDALRRAVGKPLPRPLRSEA